MPARKKANDHDVKLASLDDLFATANKDIPVESQKTATYDELHDFKNHPFHVLEDGEMEELIEDIKVQGIIYPLIVRDCPEGGYEVLAGHRRKLAGYKAGIINFPIVVNNCTDEQATLIMVGSNKYRTKLLPSELAFAYKMERDALNKQGYRTDLKLDEAEDEKDSKQEISLRQKQRYIRLTYLNSTLLDMVDNAVLPVNVGYKLSFFCDKSQTYFLDAINTIRRVPTLLQIDNIVKLEEDDILTVESVEAELLNVEIKIKESKNITIKPKKLKDYFPDNYSKNDMEEVIFKLLEQWKRDNTTSSVDINIPGQVDIEELDNGAYMPNGKVPDEYRCQELN